MIIAHTLRTRSHGICLAIGATVAAILSLHMAFAPLIPVADGEGYAMRTFALYGFLHTGQWSEFWRLLSRPVQSVLPLHDLVFFLLPPSLAGAVSYLTIQNFATYLLLAMAVHKMATVLSRPEWAPAVLLLCCVNNVALIDFYAFFLDMIFFALGLWTIACQMEAWRDKRGLSSVLAGLSLALLFWTKPANALIFLATFLLSELIRIVLTRNLPAGFARHVAGVAFGFTPLFLLALFCGGGQAILQLIDHNEIHESTMAVAHGGLFRLLYFPLCLSVFYHVLLLTGLLAVAVLVDRRLPDPKPVIMTSFPVHLFVPLLLSYLIFGEFFSLWMLVKPMRALLLMIPFVWIMLCWLWEKRRLRLELLFGAAVLYALFAFSQKACNVVNSRDQLVEGTYQLTWASWREMPSAWHGSKSFNAEICDSVAQRLSPGGIVCVNSVELWNSLIWRLGNEELLQGKAPSREVRNLFGYKGDYYDRSLLGANSLVLITAFDMQSNRKTWLQTMALLNYADGTWLAAGARGRVTELPLRRGAPVGSEIDFPQPLTPTEVDAVNQSPTFIQPGRIEENGANSLYGNHYSRKDAWALIQSWYAKRME